MLIGRRLACLLAGAWLASSSVPAASQDLLGAPRSNQVISGEVVLPGGAKAKFEVRDGTFLTIENLKQNYFFGFTGTVNPGTGHANFVPWRITRMSEDEVKVTELGRSEIYNSESASPLRDIPIGRARKFLLAQGTIIRVQDIKLGEFATPPIKGVELSSMSKEELQSIWDEVQQDYGVFANGGCCVTCQGSTVCASSVSSSCGGCDGGGGGWLAN